MWKVCVFRREREMESRKWHVTFSVGLFPLSLFLILMSSFLLFLKKGDEISRRQKERRRKKKERKRLRFQGKCEIYSLAVMRFRCRFMIRKRRAFIDLLKIENETF